MNPIFKKKKPEEVIRKTCLVPVTGDKGLCGGCNSQIVRYVKNEVIGKQGN